MPDVDATLREAGAAWRASQDVLSEHELPDFTSKRRPISGVSPIVAVSSAVVVLLLVAGGLLLQRTRLDIGVGGLQPPPAAYAIRDGDAVTGTGYLIESASGEVQLCEGGGRLDLPACSVVAVRVDGVSFDSVPGAIQAAGRWYAEHVTVHGMWTGATVVAESVSAASPEAGATDIPNPCAKDEGNGTGLGTADEEAALRALGAEVFGNPDRYAGLWRAPSADGLGRVVVNFVGDPSAVASKVRGLYPYPFCLATVAFSEADLDETVRTIGDSTPEWLAAVDYPRNRVIVSVGVLTDDLRRRLTPYSDQVLVSQLLKPA